MVKQILRKTEKEFEELRKQAVPAEIEKINGKTFISITKPFTLDKKKLTIGQKTADWLTKWAGSWTFILGFLLFLALWMAVNTTWLIFGESWDQYPFILLNLVLSCLAAIQAPIILMSQNRTNQRDRQRAEYDYQVNRKAEKGIQNLKIQLDRIERKLKR